jgi:transcriptional antiterminator RfaH
MLLDNWFLLQLKPNGQRLAERNLQRQGFETFLPMHEVTERRSTRFMTNFRPLFPGYMFVAFEAASAPWHKINSTMGVSRLVSMNGNPQSVPLDIVSGLMSRCDASGKLLPPQNLNAGDQVELRSGPFSDFIATVESIESDRRVWVLMDFMGQRTRIKVTSDQLQQTTAITVPA